MDRLGRFVGEPTARAVTAEWVKQMLHRVFFACFFFLMSHVFLMVGEREGKGSGIDECPDAEDNESMSMGTETRSGWMRDNMVWRK